MEYKECPICHSQNFLTIVENVEMSYAIKECFKCGERRITELDNQKKKVNKINIFKEKNNA